MKLPEFQTLLKTLVARPSVSSVNPAWDMGNGAVIEALEGWFAELGFQTEIQPLPNQPAKFNLIAIFGKGRDGLVLSGHTDTVPFDEAKWQSDPLILTERDGRYYGMGSADMKGFFPVIIEALRDLDLSLLKKPLVVVATADEESTMCGAKALTHLPYRLGRHALIGEPTGLRPIRMHKGISMEAVRLTGRAGHSSNPALGVNALDGMYQVIGEILAWRSELQAKHRNPAFEVEVPTINLGHIHGGDNPNRICGACELQFDLRPLPGMQLDDLRAELKSRIGRRLQDSELSWELASVFPGIPPMDTPAEAEIVRAVERLTGHPAGSAAFATEGPYFNGMGLETVVCGPGYIAQAHQPDEYIPLEHIRPAVGLVQSLIQQFCM